MSAESKVRNFHIRYGHPAPAWPPLVPDTDLVRFRGRLIREEYEELREELAALAATNDAEKSVAIMRNVLKELCDLTYVAVGTAVALGLPFEPAFNEVHASNMSKDPPKGENQKALKGDSYFKADMSKYVPGIVEEEE